MKKKFTAFLLLMFLLVPLKAQKNKDVLYLKNGSSIHGKLMEVADNQYKIKTSDGSIFIFSQTEVEKFSNESLLYDGRKTSGFGFGFEAGLLIGAQTSEYKAPFSFNLLGNYTVNTHNIFGLGSGVEYFGQPFTPLFIEYKYLVSVRKTAPFVFIRGGKLFHLHEESQNTNQYSQYDYRKNYEGGASLTIGTGISWASEDFETYLSFAYRNAYTSYSQQNYNYQTAEYKNAYNRLEIKFGFRF